MAKQRLSAVDWAFLQTETPSKLAHVAGLWVFKLPKYYRRNFWNEFMQGLRDAGTAHPPFNYRLGGGLDLPSWIEDPGFDIEDHVRFAALPAPGTTDQMLKMVSRIHSKQLDRSKPLWECYLIEGIKGRRVAIYFKVHHALLDGVATMEHLVGSLSASPEAQSSRAFWQPVLKRKAPVIETGLLGRLGKVSAGLVDQIRTVPELSATLAREGLKVLNLAESSAKAPFMAPKTPLGRAITADRKLGVASFLLPRIKKLGRNSGATVNDIVLAMSAGALRDYLTENQSLPARPLTAWVPVSLRSAEENETGNRVTVMMCSLGTDIRDSGERLEVIKSSVSAAKKELSGHSARASDNYTQLLSGLVVLTQTLGVADRLPPAANLVISNVPGPREPRYINGAMLVEQYPLSMLIDGQALNITVTSHDDRLDFGLLSCPNALPDPQRLADGLETELKRLERSFSSAAKSTTSSAAKKKAGKKPSRPGDFGQLVASLGAIPIEALNKLASGGNLSKKAWSELQKSFDRLNQAAQSLQKGASGKGRSKKEGLDGPDPELMNAQAPLWNALMDYYFRLEFAGWESLPEVPSLLIGVHSGGPLTMDAWTVALAWWRHFGEQRSLHGTAHDVLMSAPGLGSYFKRMGTISPSRENIGAAFRKGDDVILWPGGEVDAYRSWDKRDIAVLGGRTGFIRLAIREGVPIVPVATIGGHDTLFVLSEGRGLAKALGLKKRMRSDVAPITLSIPFGVTLHLTPFQHVPLPAKIRTEILEPIHLGADPDLENDNEYVGKVYTEIESVIQAGMTRLARKRKFPVLG
ncbi:MAG: wax ester/triacylglycerol synthase family O-acyltransferase [Xanthomonadales bacterium]|nr:wax ester/triacylglycerol synthase family O-acyltransferase [Gammaproteobacteria bacterium]MBT8053597.1 wax ester/triacylglycerol synthase family O-acyltransferase [Gammaproteobacteria bacterium]NND57672.1 wax ester/triacylglycerol synthase family O-acyltransferase [Xanthomonadales bacterium]NNK50985.1 wax ester/triacylglycerol synthase family O-acyltransferase [Xanthomonadales bacterium]